MVSFRGECDRHDFMLWEEGEKILTKEQDRVSEKRVKRERGIRGKRKPNIPMVVSTGTEVTTGSSLAEDTRNGRGGAFHLVVGEKRRPKGIDKNILYYFGWGRGEKDGGIILMWLRPEGKRKNTNKHMIKKLWGGGILIILLRKDVILAKSALQYDLLLI